MTIELCETFRALAFQTYDRLGKGRTVGHQSMEETFTDLNILELKVRHSQHIHSRTFTKHEEGENGADWEWWLTNSTRTTWLGLRVQAKVLNFETNKFLHLHYRKDKSKPYQLSKLKRHSTADGMVPLYCLYSHIPRSIIPSGMESSLLDYTMETWGCAIASLPHIEKLQKSKELNGWCDVLAGAIPWHHLVCCATATGPDLPSRAWELLQVQFGMPSKPGVQAGKKTVRSRVKPGLRDSAPPHVMAVMNGRVPDDVPTGVRGVLVFVDPEPKFDKSIFDILNSDNSKDRPEDQKTRRRNRKST